MVAARYHRTKTLEVLLHHGADVHIRDATGKSALDLAQAYKFSYPRSADKTIKLLKDAGASPKVAPGKCKKKRWSLSTCSKNSECVSSKSNPCTGTCMCDTLGINLCKCLTVDAIVSAHRFGFECHASLGGLTSLVDIQWTVMMEDEAIPCIVFSS